MMITSIAFGSRLENAPIERNIPATKLTTPMMIDQTIRNNPTNTLRMAERMYFFQSLNELKSFIVDNIKGLNLFPLLNHRLVRCNAFPTQDPTL